MLLLALVLAAAPAPARLPPVDECTADPTFVRFRTDLGRVIVRRDANSLLSMVADDVYVSFGGYHGKKDFIDFWGLRQPQSSKVWSELKQALQLGCAVEGDVRSAPSFGAQMGGSRDVFETLIALPSGVLRRSPSDRSAAVARLNWHVLTVRAPWDGGPWVAVRLDDGRRGFIRRSQARSPIDYRAGFHKRGGRWLMTSFVAGD